MVTPMRSRLRARVEWFEWQAQRETCSAPGAGVNLQRARVRFGDPSGQVQAQTQADGARAGSKALEQARQHVRRNAWPAILDSDRGPRLAGSHVDQHRVVIWLDLQGVRKQILDRLPQAHGISAHDQLRLLRSHLYGAWRKVRDRLAQQLHQVHRTNAQREQALLQACGVEQLVHQLLEPIDGPHHLVSVAHIPLVSVTPRAPAHHADAHAEWRQKVAQVVRQDGDQLLGRGPSSVSHGFARGGLHELSPVRDYANPVRDGPEGAQVGLTGELRRCRDCGQHSATGAGYVKWHADIRPYAQPLADTPQLLLVEVNPPAVAWHAGFKDLDHPPTVGYG